MGRELQKKKNRSGVSKVRHKPKSKKKVLHNPIIAANWDKTQTLSQNYKRLGLTAKLNKSTGGVEKKGSDDLSRQQRQDEVAHQDEVDSLVIGKKRKAEKMDVKEAKILRDPQTGHIVQVIDSEPARENPLSDTLNALDSDSEVEPGVFTQHASSHVVSRTDHDRPKIASEVLQRLESEAARPAAKHKPKQSEIERAFIAELVAKYGDDYAKMARDMKINYMQRSEGDLKRRVKKWRESGGRVSG